MTKKDYEAIEQKQWMENTNGAIYLENGFNDGNNIGYNVELDDIGDVDTADKFVEKESIFLIDDEDAIEALKDDDVGLSIYLFKDNVQIERIVYNVSYLRFFKNEALVIVDNPIREDLATAKKIAAKNKEKSVAVRDNHREGFDIFSPIRSLFDDDFFGFGMPKLPSFEEMVKDAKSNPNGYYKMTQTVRDADGKVTVKEFENGKETVKEFLPKNNSTKAVEKHTCDCGCECGCSHPTTDNLLKEALED